jgi:hypothetical protein
MRADRISHVQLASPPPTTQKPRSVDHVDDLCGKSPDYLDRALTELP